MSTENCDALMREATRLAAAGGELGSSDAIRLLQIPHSAQEVEAVIQMFGSRFTPEASSKLRLEALVPQPAGVDSQRHEPFFDRYLISGKTYTTRGGQVIPNELHYYDGEMLQVYGECANLSVVNDALAGSGYRAVTVHYPDGHQNAVAQLWVSRFTDTTILPYSAMFIVVAVVRDDMLGRTAAPIRAHANGASSALAMLDGAFDHATQVFQNKARLFLVRLLDSTQIAIDVGRERMGTDKRPGAIALTRDGHRLRIAVKDASGCGVVNGEVELSSQSTTYLAEVAKAAATAGIALRTLPHGTECVYPAVARIGRGPVVEWQWRSDRKPHVQAVGADALTFDSGSEEGRILLAWGFTPKVLAYVPRVCGAVTGLTDQAPRLRDEVPAPANTSVPPQEAITVFAPRTVEPAAALDSVAFGTTVPLLRAPARGSQASIAGALPVLRLVGSAVTHALPLPHAIGDLATRERPRLTGTEVVALGAPSAGADEALQPRWTWNMSFLGSLTARLRKELVGVTPDGLRINWHVTEGRFVGPGLDAVVTPGAADWMRIRRDGVAIVNVQACFETRDGARVFGAYGGIFDLGRDGFARALRDEYDPLPPVVVTPTYATADTRLDWLNRAQCVGVGRVDMKTLRVEFDVYVVRVGDATVRSPVSPNTTTRSAGADATSLYDRVGGRTALAAITDDFLSGVLADRQLKRFFTGPIQANLRERVVDLLCHLSGGPFTYTGRDMKTAHRGLGISEDDWRIAVELFIGALQRHGAAARERAEFLKIVEGTKRDIVEVHR